MKIPFCEFFNMKILLQSEQNKTAWKILKANKIKRNIKATKPKIKEKLKTKCLHARQPQKKIHKSYMHGSFFRRSLSYMYVIAAYIPVKKAE